ncbi:hypothetical protein BOO23_21600 [Vibrio navarrensis]|nr:hypothetical protein [Vibrio navarrensis]
MEAFQNWKRQAELHWKQFQPKRYAELKKAGALETALTEAAEQTALEMNQLTESGFQPDEAFQMVREQYLFPPEENSGTLAPEMGQTSLTHQMIAAVKKGSRTMDL